MNTSAPVRKIVILGGGTAGWMAAAFIQRALSTEHHPCSITVIASEEIGTVGVGEATIPTIRRTLQYIGLEPHQWMQECTSTYKLAVRFMNWTKIGHEYWHPFGPLTLDTPTFEAVNYWLRAKQEGETQDFATLFYPAVHFAKSGSLAAIDEAKVARAYHLDATLLGRLLKRIAIERGVQYRSDEIVSVNHAENGFIKSLVTKAGQEIEGDLFIDCSGFRSLLLQGDLKEPFDSYGDGLICDRAVALSSKITESPQVQVTSAIAMSSGWSWHIPLTTRNGIGYVYSSAHLSAEEAEKEVRKLAGPPSDSYESRHIKMRIGKHRRTWVKNCVAVGLAGGFIEPLESTGIFLIESGLRTLMMLFPDCSCDERLSNLYNEEMTKYYEEIRDFIVMHYVISKRTDTQFWRDASDDKRMTPRLKQCLDDWKHTSQLPLVMREDKIFPIWSWAAVLLGAGIFPTKPMPLFAGMESDHVTKFIDFVRYMSHLDLAQ